MNNTTHLFEAESYEPEYLIKFRLNSTSKQDYDDNMTSEEFPEVTLQAPSLEFAVRYGQQYARKMSQEDPSWKSAEIISATLL